MIESLNSSGRRASVFDVSHIFAYSLRLLVSNVVYTNLHSWTPWLTMTVFSEKRRGSNNNIAIGEKSVQDWGCLIGEVCAYSPSTPVSTATLASSIWHLTWVRIWWLISPSSLNAEPSSGSSHFCLQSKLAYSDTVKSRLFRRARACDF